MSASPDQLSRRGFLKNLVRRAVNNTVPSDLLEGTAQGFQNDPRLSRRDLLKTAAGGAALAIGGNILRPQTTGAALPDATITPGTGTVGGPETVPMLREREVLTYSMISGESSPGEHFIIITQHDGAYFLANGRANHDARDPFNFEEIKKITNFTPVSAAGAVTGPHIAINSLFSPDKMIIAGDSSSGGMFIWTKDGGITWQERYTTGGRNYGAEITPDGKYVYFFSAGNRTMKRFDFNTGVITEYPMPGFAAGLSDIKINPQNPNEYYAYTIFAGVPGGSYGYYKATFPSTGSPRLENFNPLQGQPEGMVPPFFDGQNRENVWTLNNVHRDPNNPNNIIGTLFINTNNQETARINPSRRFLPDLSASLGITGAVVNVEKDFGVIAAVAGYRDSTGIRYFEAFPLSDPSSESRRQLVQINGALNWLKDLRVVGGNNITVRLAYVGADTYLVATVRNATDPSNNGLYKIRITNGINNGTDTWERVHLMTPTNPALSNEKTKPSNAPKIPIKPAPPEKRLENPPHLLQKNNFLKLLRKLWRRRDISIKNAVVSGIN